MQRQSLGFSSFLLSSRSFPPLALFLPLPTLFSLAVPLLASLPPLPCLIRQPLTGVASAGGSNAFVSVAITRSRPPYSEESSISLNDFSLCLKVLDRLDPRAQRNEDGEEDEKKDCSTRKESSEGRDAKLLRDGASADVEGGQEGHTGYRRKTWTVASKDEPTLLACLKTFYVLVFLDISHRTGRMPKRGRMAVKKDLFWKEHSKLPCFTDLSGRHKLSLGDLPRFSLPTTPRGFSPFFSYATDAAAVYR